MDAYDNFIFTHAGRQFRAALYFDYDAGAPWDREEGHGAVSEWTRRDKKPGEMVLHEDRGFRRYYDYSGAVAMARADGWGADGATPGDRAARAALADFERLRRWCADEWHYCGVSVVAIGPGGEPPEDEFSFALWGIESDCRDYIEETARELAGDAWAALRSEVEGEARVKRARVRECLTLAQHCQAPGAWDRYRNEARRVLAELRELRDFLKGAAA